MWQHHAETVGVMPHVSGVGKLQSSFVKHEETQSTNVCMRVCMCIETNGKVVFM